MNRQYFLEIYNDSGQYHGRLHWGDPDKARLLPQLALGPDDRLTIRDKTHTLRTLSQALIDFNPQILETIFDERGQLEWGQYLYSQVFGSDEQLAKTLPMEREIELRIVTDDEHILRLPWVLLARGGVFLTTTGWSVTLDRPGALDDVHLPPSPTMLVVAPQPAGEPDTQAEAHLEELEEMLSQADHHFYQGRHLRVARSWGEFKSEVSAQHFDVLYYYGHGVGDRDRSRLIFAKAKAGKRQDVPVMDLVNRLQKSPGGPPLLAYVNCCQGDAGGVLGAGRQLLNRIPAVLTNRTVAYIDAARRQAMAFWRMTLLEGVPPHTAVAGMYSQLGDLDFSFKNTRWMTPVLHGHYRRWQASPPRSRDQPDWDPHWRIKVDRVRQFSQVAYQSGQMLREHQPHALAYVWYGQEGQGVDLFHQRLKVELREILPDVHLYEVRPRWPDDLHNRKRSFEDMLLEAFEVLSLDAIADRIRTQTRGESGRRILVYVRHEPVLLPGDLLKPKELRTYLEWWDYNLAHRLPRASAFGLLGVSFIVDKPPKFLDTLRQRTEDLELQHTVYHILDEMEQLAKKDLQDFLKTYHIALPTQRREQVINKILDRTNGHYELTLAALKEEVERAWDQEEEGTSGEGASTEEPNEYD